jgi:hypothetical protein
MGLGEMEMIRLKDTQDILSLGRRIHPGIGKCDFFWTADDYEHPKLIKPDGTIITLRVTDYVPILDDDGSADKDPNPVLTALASTVTESVRSRVLAAICDAMGYALPAGIQKRTSVTRTGRR